MRSVAKRAGVSHAAPAHHFADVTELLTALAALGYERFVEFQNARQQAEGPDVGDQLIALGLGYIDFAIAHPALFRLMFSSQKPDRHNSDLAKAMMTAFEKLAGDTSKVTGRSLHDDPKGMTDVIAAWAMVHGIADLMISNRLEYLTTVPVGMREEMIRDIVRRSVNGIPKD